jgi:hypothetical protein
MYDRLPWLRLTAVIGPHSDVGADRSPVSRRRQAEEESARGRAFGSAVTILGLGIAEPALLLASLHQFATMWP